MKITIPFYRNNNNNNYKNIGNNNNNKYIYSQNDNFVKALCKIIQIQIIY